jgi:hypothetical protein
MDLKRMMFRNSDNDNDTKAGHTRSGRLFRGVHLENLFKKNYGEEGFYNGEEVDLTDEECTEPSRPEEGETEELRQDEPKIAPSMLTWHQANSLPFIAKAMLNRLFKNLLNQVTRALTHCWARWNAGRPYTARVGTRAGPLQPAFT